MAELKNQKITVSLTTSQHVRFCSEAEARGLKPGEYLREIVTRHLDDDEQPATTLQVERLNSKLEKHEENLSFLTQELHRALTKTICEVANNHCSNEEVAGIKRRLDQHREEILAKISEV